MKLRIPVANATNAICATVPLLLMYGLTLAALTTGQSGRAAEQNIAAQFTHPVQFELGDAEFAPGDSITIQAIRGTSELITVGQTYLVEGTYTLSSRDEARLSLFATTSNPTPTPVDSRQTVNVPKGSGNFQLIKTMNEEGFLHLTFYPAGSGSGFGGIYFGQGNGVLRNKNFSYLHSSRPPDKAAGQEQVSFSRRNQSLCEYLGDPVQAANFNAAYTEQGLVEATRTAAQLAGISLRKIEVDDSEFPYLLGIVCEENDFFKLQAQFRKMEGYDYTGSVGGHGHYAINIVPWRVFPSESSQRIGRRLTLRQQMLHDKISRE